MPIKGTNIRIDFKAMVRSMEERSKRYSEWLKTEEGQEWQKRQREMWTYRGSLERTPEEQREWEERHPGFMSESEGASLRYWRESEN